MALRFLRAVTTISCERCGRSSDLRKDTAGCRKKSDLLARVEKRSEKRAPVEIFTPKELAALFGNASAEVAPCLALAAFAGLRSAEILRLDWPDIERHAGFIEVAAHKAKTATRRIVPLTTISRAGWR